jgi:Na+/alanine symporter
MTPPHAAATAHVPQPQLAGDIFLTKYLQTAMICVLSALAVVLREHIS